MKIRACDRCRKRKHRCDGLTPTCSGCLQAGALCETTSIPQKRGPRPRVRQPATALEQRLAHLESLLVSIPHDSSSASLSDAERSAVRLAAQGDWNSLEDGTAYLGDWAAAEVGGGGEVGLDETASSAGDHAFQGHWWGNTPEASTSALDQTNWDHDAALDYSSAFTPVNTAFPAHTYLAEPSYTSNNGPFVSDAPSHFAPAYIPSTLSAPAPPSTTVEQQPPPVPAGSRRHLIYRDDEDQLKFVGPSSGLPLLDLLKQMRGSDSVSSPPTAADFEPTAELGPDEILASELLWKQALKIVATPVMHELIRGYFDVSYLLYPYLHMPTFLKNYLASQPYCAPPFIPLVLSICCLSTRYSDDPRSSSSVGDALFDFCKNVLATDQSVKATIDTVQAYFNLAVYAEGTTRPGASLELLSTAVTLALDIGLHRRVDDWAAFSPIEIEVRKRTFYAIYCLSVKACTNYGRPPLIRLADVDVPEPLAVDDAFITLDGVGMQPIDKPSVQAGFVAAIRLHMLLERTLEVINSVPADPFDTSFAARVLSRPLDGLISFPDNALLESFAEDLPGVWVFNPMTINDSDTIRFFQRTRAFAMQQFVRVLIARHRLLYELERSTEGGGVYADNLRELIQAALGIVGCYATIKARGRMKFFGVHAIVQLAQSGSALTCVMLHTQGSTSAEHQQTYAVATQGLEACLAILRHLGERRPAGYKSASILAEFASACDITLGSPGAAADESSPSSATPLVRVLPRKEAIRRSPASQAAAPQVDTSALNWMLAAAFGEGPGYSGGYSDGSVLVPVPSHSSSDVPGIWQSLQ